MYTILTLKAWQGEIKARAARGRHYGIVLSGIPFRVQESMIAVWSKILKPFGTLSSYSINERSAKGSGFDGSVTLGFDLGELSAPTHLPKIPLIYGGTYYLSLDPRLGQVRIIGEKSCRACPALEGHCADAAACATRNRELSESSAKARSHHRRAGAAAAAAVMAAAPPAARSMVPPPPPSAMPPPPPDARATVALKQPPQDDPARADRTRSFRGFARCVRADWVAAEAARHGRKICPDYMSNTKTCAVGRACPLYHHEMPPPSTGAGAS